MPTSAGGGGPPPVAQPTGGSGHPLPAGQNPQAAGPTTDPAPLPGAAPRPTAGPQVQSGGAPAKLDKASQQALTDYVNQLPAGLRNNPLDFETSAVPRDQINALVTKEGGLPDRVNSTINDIGGPNAQVSRTPILISNGKGGFSAKGLLSVKDSDGVTHLVDQDGAKYTDFQDYLENNRLDKSWTVTRPAGLGAPGADAGQIVTGPAHVVSQGEQTAQKIDKIATGLGVAGTTVEVAGGVAEAGTLGAGTPVVAAMEGVGGVLQGVSGGWSTLRMIDQAVNNYQHGRDLIDGTELADMASGPGTVLRRRSAEGGFRGETTPEEAKETFGNDPESLPPGQRAAELGEDGADVGLIKPDATSAPKSTGQSAPIQASPTGTGAGPKNPLDLVQVDRSKVSGTISQQRQARHILGGRGYDGGGYFKDPAEAQKVLDAFRNGSAQVLSTGNNGQVKIRYKGAEGYNNNRGAGYPDQPTDIYIIKGTSSVSVVPTTPQ
jgi:hypothetical protein